MSINSERLKVDREYWEGVHAGLFHFTQTETEKCFGVPRPEPQQVEDREAPDLFYEVLGWAHAQCCIWLDEGKDPRTEDCSQLVPMAEKDFGIRTKDQRDHEELANLLFAFGMAKLDCRPTADAIIAAGWRKDQ